MRGSWLTAGSTALYNVRMVVPALPPGTATLQINVQGTPSNGARVFVVERQKSHRGRTWASCSQAFTSRLTRDR